MKKLLLFLLLFSTMYGNAKIPKLTWEALTTETVIEMEGEDANLRPLFIAFQAEAEQLLTKELHNRIQSVKGFIHTPMPATPLCTIGNARRPILESYLAKGGDLYVVYPKEGLYRRTEEEQGVYKQELLNFSEHLFDTPLEMASIPPELIGATYFFQDQKGQTFVFSIKMTQANDIQTMAHFGFWLGPLDAPAIQERVKDISLALEQSGKISPQR